MRRARCCELRASDRYVRATNDPAAAVRRRNLLVPLIFSGSAGPLGAIVMQETQMINFNVILFENYEPLDVFAPSK